MNASSDLVLIVAGFVAMGALLVLTRVVARVRTIRGRLEPAVVCDVRIVMTGNNNVGVTMSKIPDEAPANWIAGCMLNTWLRYMAGAGLVIDYDLPDGSSVPLVRPLTAGPHHVHQWHDYVETAPAPDLPEWLRGRGLQSQTTVRTINHRCACGDKAIGPSAWCAQVSGHAHADE